MTTLKALTLASKRILVVGDIMLDRYWFGDVNRISPEAPVPILSVQRHENRLGGAANVSRNLTSLGTQASLLGIVGKDEASETLIHLLHEANIGNYLEQDSAFSTIVKLRVIGHQQHLLRIDFEKRPPDAALRNSLKQYENLLKEHDIVVLSDYAKGGLAHISDLIRLANQADKKVLIDPKGDDFSPYSGAFILTPNKSEFKQVAGNWKTEAELSTKAQNFRKALNLTALLLTRSEEGMTLYTEEEITHVPAVAQEVYDVSGAGDTVIATLAALLAAEVPLKEAVWYANHAGGIVVSKLGTAVLTLKELIDKVDQLTLETQLNPAS